MRKRQHEQVAHRPFSNWSGALGVLLLVSLLLPLTGAPPPIPHTAYIEPALLLQDAEALSVIVTADDSEAAARAVERVGGQVTSDLWLIDAVAAKIPANQLKALARDPGVRSVANNKSVKTADQPGWVTERRIQKGKHGANGAQRMPAVRLPDGGSVSVAENGSVLILNASAVSAPG